MATFNSVNSNFTGNNTFLGSGSGNITLSGEFNVGLGSETLNSLTTGDENVGIGYNSLTAVTTGNNNVAFGNITGNLITTGSSNTVVGSSSLSFLDTGSNNVVIGYLNGSNYTTNESDNIVIATGFAGTPGESHKIYIGVDGSGANEQDTCSIAGDVTVARGLTVTNNLHLSNTNGAGTVGEITFGGNRWISNYGADNTFVGETSGNTTLNLIGSPGNTAIGKNTLSSLNHGAYNTALGIGAGNAITNGDNNIAIGENALFKLTTGLKNISIGDESLFNLITGSDNVCIGYQAGVAYTGAESNNILLGNAGVLGESNIMRLGTDGSGTRQQTDCYIAGNTRVTRNLMLPTTTATVGQIQINSNPVFHQYGNPSNTFVGYPSGNFTLTGNSNTGVGAYTLNGLTNGSSNSAFGIAALRFMQSGSFNVCFGESAMSAGTSGNGNCIFGFQSSGSINGGNYNIDMGFQSLQSLTTGSYNIVYGYLAGNGYTGAESSNILFSNAGTVGESNVIRLGTTGAGNGQQNKCFIAGTTGVTPSVAGAKLMIIDTAGQVGSLGAATNGQIAIGSTGANPALATITAGTGISVTNGAGSITIANSSLPTIWSVETADMNIVVGHGYISNKAGLLTYTLPATAAVGDIIEISNMNTAVGWRIAQNANQYIRVGSSLTSVGVGGYVEATALGDSIKLVCMVAGASTGWIAVHMVGNLTVA